MEDEQIERIRKHANLVNELVLKTFRFEGSFNHCQKILNEMLITMTPKNILKTMHRINLN